ncbi:MAG TPA: hypothetical protein VF136_13015 [Methylomirabilota bacterium]
MTLNLVEVVCRKLDDGRLPADGPVKTWAGYGRGRPCSVCDEVIGPGQVEYELESEAQGPVYCFHVSCHAIWEAERHRRRRPPRDP